MILMLSVVPGPATLHYLSAPDAGILAGSCMLLGCLMTMIGFKLAPIVKRYYRLIMLKIFMFKWG